MISFSLEEAMQYAKENKIPRVIEIKCPREDCGKTMYAVTDSDKHEHEIWLQKFRRDSFKRHIACRRCGYGMFSDSEGSFIFKTHNVGFK